MDGRVKLGFLVVVLGGGKPGGDAGSVPELRKRRRKLVDKGWICSNHEGGKEEKMAADGAPQRKQVHRCRFCKEEGHNIRSCPKMKQLNPNGYHRQTCTLCGHEGHNRRNCPELSRRNCQICKGTGRVVCLACQGYGSNIARTRAGSDPATRTMEAPTSPPSYCSSTSTSSSASSAKKEGQDVLRLRAKARVEEHMNRLRRSNKHMPFDDLNILVNKGDMCNVCDGAGLLTCLNCGT